MANLGERVSDFQRFDAVAFLSRISANPSAKLAKVAKELPEVTSFSRISDFSSPSAGSAETEECEDSPAEEDRHAWSVELCRRLTAGIAHQSPPGLGRWEPAWEIVAAPSERLLDALADWERTGAEADRRAALCAAEDVAIAWERAAIAWSKDGRDQRPPFLNQ